MDAKFPNGPVNNFKDVFDDPQVNHNGMIQTITDDIFGVIKQVRYYKLGAEGSPP